MQILFIAFAALMAVLNIAAIYTGVIALFTFKKRRPYPDAAPETLGCRSRANGGFKIMKFHVSGLLSPQFLRP